MSFSEILKPRPEVLSEEGIEGIIDIQNLKDTKGKKLEANPRRFFSLTYPTADVKRIIQKLADRFSGKKDAPGLFLFEGAPHGTQVVLDNGVAAGKSPLGKALQDDGGGDLRVLFKHHGDLISEGVQFAAPAGGFAMGARIGKVFSDTLAADEQFSGDRALGEPLVVQAMDLKDGASVDHVRLPGNG